MGGGGDSKPKIHFTVSKDISNVNFFEKASIKNLSDFSFLQVYINDTLTEQTADSISASAGDDIKIVSLTDSYPFFNPANSYPRQMDCIASIEEPLPFMGNAYLFDYFAGYFSGCRSLISIPQGLFNNNTKVTNFSDCFSGCRNLTVNVRIGSTTTDSVDVNYFARNTAAKGTVYCRAGSAAYEAFSSTSSANVNVLTY